MVGVGGTSAGRPEWRAQKKHGTRDRWDEGVLQLAADHVLFTPADAVDESASTTVPYVHLTVRTAHHNIIRTSRHLYAQIGSPISHATAVHVLGEACNPPRAPITLDDALHH